MEGITLNTIPSWIPGLAMLYTGFVWLVTRKSRIRMDSRILAATLLIWGCLYIIGSVAPENTITSGLVIRVLLSRIVITLICLSQSLPLTVSYFRGKGRESNGE